jgi:hypothetical protein
MIYVREGEETETQRKTSNRKVLYK